MGDVLFSSARWLQQDNLQEMGGPGRIKLAQHGGQRWRGRLPALRWGSGVSKRVTLKGEKGKICLRGQKPLHPSSGLCGSWGFPDRDAAPIPLLPSHCSHPCIAIPQLPSLCSHPTVPIPLLPSRCPHPINPISQLPSYNSHPSAPIPVPPSHCFHPTAHGAEPRQIPLLALALPYSAAPLEKDQTPQTGNVSQLLTGSQIKPQGSAG